MPNDPDLLALQAAERDAAAEDGTPPAPPAATPVPAATPAPAPPAAPAPTAAAQAAPTPPPEPMVPLSRVAQSSATIAKLLSENDQLKGALAVLQQPPPAAPAAPAEAADPIGDRFSELDSKKLALAEKLDASEITNAEYVRQVAVIDAEVMELNNQVLLATVAHQIPTPQAPAGDGDVAKVISDAHGQLLEQQYPYLTALTGQQLQWLAQKAEMDAAAAGKPYGADLASTLALRDHVGRLAQEFGPMLAPSARVAQPAAAPASPAAPLSPLAQLRDGKLRQKAAAPPDPTTMGAPAAGTVQLTEAQIEKMPAHMLEKLPLSVLDKLG